MRHFLTAREHDAQAFGNLAQRVLLNTIEAQPDPAARKAMILAAYEAGAFSIATAENLIHAYGLENV